MSVPISVPFPTPFPFLLFIYIEGVPFNYKMTTVSSVAVKVVLCRATVVAVTWDPQPSLLSHLTCRPLDWPSQQRTGGTPGAQMRPSTKLGCQTVQQEVMLPCPGPWVCSRELGSLSSRPFTGWLVSVAAFLLSNSTILYTTVGGRTADTFIKVT